MRKTHSDFVRTPYIPVDKRSKKEQEAFYRTFRRTWNGVSPVTRVSANRRHYDRAYEKDRLRKEKADA